MPDFKEFKKMKNKLVFKSKNAIQRIQQMRVFQQCNNSKGLSNIIKSNKYIKMLDVVGCCWMVLDCWIVGWRFCVIKFERLNFEF